MSNILDVRLLARKDNWLYYIREDGQVYKVDKNIPRPERKQIFLSIYYKRNVKTKPVCKVLSKEINIKTELIKAFRPREYFDGCCIYFKDNDPTNLNVDNLEVLTREESGRRTGNLNAPRRVVITKDGKTYKFKSIKETAKFIGVRKQTLDYYQDVMKAENRDKSKICKLGFKVKFIYRSEGDYIG